MFQKIVLLALGIGALALRPVAAQELLPPTFDEYRRELKTTEINSDATHMSAPGENSLASETGFNAVRQVLAQPMEYRASLEIPTNLSPKHRKTLTEIRDEMRTLEQTKNALLNTKSEALADQLGSFYGKLKTLNTEIKNLKSQLRSENDNFKSEGGASVLPLPGAATPSASLDTDAQVEAEFSQVDQELQYREELIKRLLDALEQQKVKPSTLGASLLAVSEHPLTSGLLGATLLLAVWLLRGRIAELSGFGIKVVLNQKTSTRKKRRG